MPRPAADEYAVDYEPYIGLVPEPDVLPAMAAQPAELSALLGGLSEAEANTAHAPYTWTVKQVLGHCIDNERVFGHRAARFAANDETPQPGYDQDAAVAAFDYTGVSLPDLLAEFTALRRSHELFFPRLTPRQ